MLDDQRFEALNEMVVELLTRQRELEQRLAVLEGALRIESPIATQASTLQAVAVAVPVLSSPASEAERPPNLAQEEQPHPETPAIETKVGLTIVNRVGVVTLILGIAFFFKWAVDNDWIGPIGRVLLGLLAGFVTLAIADSLWRKAQQIFAQGLTGAGLAILYLAAYAAFGFYHLVPQVAAFAFLASLTALGYALSLRYNSIAIAALGLLGGYITPLLLSDGSDHPWFLHLYLLLLDGAAMTLVRRKSWHLLASMALLATSLVSLSWVGTSMHHLESIPGTLGTLANFALFTLTGSWVIAAGSGALAALQIWQVWPDSAAPFFALQLLIAAASVINAKRKNAVRALPVAFAAFWIVSSLFLLSATHSSVGAEFAGLSAGYLLFLVLLSGILTPSFEVPTNSLGLVVANGLTYYGLAYLILRNRHHSWLGLLAIVVAATYLTVAALLRRRRATTTNLETPILIAIGMAMAFITLAIPIQLTGFRITIGWSIQAAALAWIGMRTNQARAVVVAAIILLLVAFRLLIFGSSFAVQSSEPVTLVINSRFATFCIAAVCTFLAARWTVTISRKLALWEALGGHIVLLAGLTLETLLWAQQTSETVSLLSVETAAISILFAIYAVALVSLGVMSRTAINRVAGLGLLGFVIAKLYFFDVWQLDRVYRIAAFVVLGLLLISTSFLYSRFRPVIESLLKNDEAAS